MRRKEVRSTIAGEFAGGLLPNLTGSQPDSLPASQQDAPARKKVTLYLDAPDHTNLMDDILTALVRKHGLPRDNSMLVRALLTQARAVLEGDAQLAALAELCRQTPPSR